MLPAPPLQHVDPETHPAVVRLRAAMPEAIEGVTSHRDQVSVRINRPQWVAAAQFPSQLRIQILPEARQVGRHLYGAMIRGE